MAKIFSHFLSSLFTFLIVSFAVKKFSLIPSHLLILDFTSCALGISLRNLVPKPTCGKVGPTFSSSRYRVSDLMPRPLIYFELSFIQGER